MPPDEPASPPPVDGPREPSAGDLPERLAAAVLAAGRWHGDQTRKGTTVPYVSHLLQVAALVLEHGGSTDAAVAAVLHDVVEDTPATLAEVEAGFGERVAAVVADLTDLLPGDTPDHKSPWRVRKERHLAHLAGVGPESALVAACDKLHNLQGLLADARADGPGAIGPPRFSADLAGHLWFHRGALDALGPRAPESVVAELRRAVAELEALAARAAPHEPRIEVHLSTDDIAAGLRRDVLEGLTATPKALPPKWFYDERGSDLFDRITRLDEYYPTRREREILGRHADDIAAVSAADTVVELGSGTSEKTRVLLDALRVAGRLRRFCPFDVSESFLREAAASIAAEYPGVEVHGVVGDFDHHLPLLPRGGRRLVAFLGGTVGNYPPDARKALLAELVAGMEPGDSLLLGTDLVKDERRLVAAYDDTSGVTAAFNRNVLAVINRELGGDFRPECFDHVARWDPEEEWVEMRLRSREHQVATIADLDLRVTFGTGEELRTEVSAKFRRERVEAELAAAGARLVRWWTDAAGDYALSLSVVAG